MKSMIQSVGNTPLEPLPDLHGRQIWAKREDHNLFGTHKDRRSALIRKEYLEQPAELRPDVLAIFSAGNAALSLGLLTEDLPLQVRSILPHGTTRSIFRALERAGIDTMLGTEMFALDSRMIINLLRHDAGERIWNVTNGYEFAYAQIVREIAAVTKPDAIVCPIGSGELLVGLHRGLVELGMRNTKLIGVSVECGTRSKANKLEAFIQPYREQIQKLLKEQQLLQITMDAKDVRRSMQKVPDGIRAEPSAAVVFGVPERLESLSNIVQNIVLINTGKGIV